MSKVTPWLVTAVLIAAGVILVFSSTREDISDRSTMGAIFDSLQYPEYLSVVALVNGTEIHGRDIQMAVAFKRLAAPGNATSDVDPRAVLELAITQELLFQEAGRRGLQCGDGDVYEMAASFFEGASQKPSGDVDTDSQLTLEEYLAGLADLLGVSMEDLARHPEFTRPLARDCAHGQLIGALIDENPALRDTENYLAYVAELRASLVASGDVQILEPSLQ